MNAPERINFSQVIADLEAAGITTYKLAMMMHRQYNQIKRWKNGSEPRHYEGEMLLLIRAAYVKDPSEKSGQETQRP